MRGQGVELPKPVRAVRDMGRGTQRGWCPREISWGLAHTWLSIAQEDNGRARQPDDRVGRPESLVAEFQLLHDSQMAGRVGAVEVIQQATALTDHHQQSAARAVVFGKFLQVLGELVDALGEQGDLHVGRASVFFVETKILHDFRFVFQFRTHLRLFVRA